MSMTFLITSIMQLNYCSCMTVHGTISENSFEHLSGYRVHLMVCLVKHKNINLCFEIFSKY